MTITAKRKKIVAFLRSLDVDAPATWAKKILPPERKNTCPICGDKPNDITRYNKKTQEIILHGEFDERTYNSFSELLAECKKNA